MNAREASVGRQLAGGILRGLWTLEDLDKPSRGWEEVENDRVRSLYPDDKKAPWEPRTGPAMRYPGAGTRRPVRNLAREWIDAHPDQWAAMQAGEEPETVGGLGTPESREAARQAVRHYDSLVAAGYDFNAGLERTHIDVPDMIEGPIGYRPPGYRSV